MLNGDVVKDLFPEWNTILRGRIDRNHPSQQSFSGTLKTGHSTLPMATDAFMSTPIARTEVKYWGDQNGNIPRPMEGVSQSDPGIVHNLGEGAAATGIAAESNFLVEDTSARDARFKTPKSGPPQGQRSTSQRRSRSKTRAVQIKVEN